MYPSATRRGEQEQKNSRCELEIRGGLNGYILLCREGLIQSETCLLEIAVSELSNLQLL